MIPNNFNTWEKYVAFVESNERLKRPDFYNQVVMTQLPIAPLLGYYCETCPELRMVTANAGAVSDIVYHGETEQERGTEENHFSRNESVFFSDG